MEITPTEQLEELYAKLGRCESALRRYGNVWGLTESGRLAWERRRRDTETAIAVLWSGCGASVLVLA